MENENLNKSLCEELFGGELDVVEVPDSIECEKSQAGHHRDWLYWLNEAEWCIVQKVVRILKEIENFCKTKKNMFLPIRNGITKALRELENLNESMEDKDCYIEHFELYLRDKMLKKMKVMEIPKKAVIDESSQTTAQPAPRSTPEPRKQQREVKVSPEVTASKKQEEKRTKTSKHPEDWVEVPARRDLWKKKPKPALKKSEWLKRARSEAVIIKPVEGINYAAILKSLKNMKSRVNPERKIEGDSTLLFTA